jgi:hypothetical protein
LLHLAPSLHPATDFPLLLFGPNKIPLGLILEKKENKKKEGI